jgi:hypothetical protein
MKRLIILGLAAWLLAGCATTKIVEAKRVAPTIKQTQPPTISAEEKRGEVPTLRPLMPQIPLVPADYTPPQ